MIDTFVSDEDLETFVSFGLSESTESDFVISNLYLEAVTTGQQNGYLQFYLKIASQNSNINFAPFFDGDIT